MAEKKKTDIDLPFFKIKEDEEGTYVKIGPIEVVDKEGEEEKAKIGPIRVSEKGARYEPSSNDRLEVLAFAVFLILIGCVWFAENITGYDFTGAVAIGFGAILLSLNYARSRLGIETSTFTIVLGIVAVIYGVAERFFVDTNVLAVLALAVGLYLIIAFGREARK